VSQGHPLEKADTRGGGRDALRPLLVAQARLLIEGVRRGSRLHEACGKFSTAEFNVCVVVLVHFAGCT
jgi:hypothetical protein